MGSHLLSLDRREEFGHFHREGRRQLLDVHQTQVPGAAFHIAQVGAVDARFVCEVFLGQLQFFTAELHGCAEPFADIGFRSPLDH